MLPKKSITNFRSLSDKSRGTIEKSDHWFEFGFAALVDKVSISTIDQLPHV